MVRLGRNFAWIIFRPNPVWNHIVSIEIRKIPKWLTPYSLCTDFVITACKFHNEKILFMSKLIILMIVMVLQCFSSADAKTDKSQSDTISQLLLYILQNERNAKRNENNNIHYFFQTNVMHAISESIKLRCPSAQIRLHQEMHSQKA